MTNNDFLKQIENDSFLSKVFAKDLSKLAAEERINEQIRYLQLVEMLQKAVESNDLYYRRNR